MEELKISTDNILVNEIVQNNEEIIRKLGELLYKNKYVKDTYVQAVLDREKEFPTGLQTTTVGFAIPHSKAKHVRKSTVAVATLNSPVMFKAMDNPEVDIPVSVVMMLAISDPEMVIDTLTKVISILEYEATIEKIINATAKQEIQEAVSNHIHKIRETKGSVIENLKNNH